MFGARSRLAFAGAIVTAATAVGVGMAVGGAAPSDARAPLAAAIASLPAGTNVAGFTDWQHIVDRYRLDAARDRDLVTRSAVIDDLDELTGLFGWRPGDLSWEVFGQGNYGGVAVVKLRDKEPTKARLSALGYRRTGHYWMSTGRIAAEEPLHTVIAVPRRNLVLLSTDAKSVAAAMATIEGRTRPFAAERDAADVVQALAGAQSALIQRSSLGCEATAVVVDTDTGNQVDAAEARAGRVEPYTMLGRGMRDDGSRAQTFVLAMTFDSAAKAARQARIRADLSHGPFIGRSEAMSDVLRLQSWRSDGSTAVVTYGHPFKAEYLMTGQGPLLPAAC